MKKYNWIKTLILSVVTFGIYSIIVWYGMTNAHNTLAGKYEKKTIAGFIVAFLLSIVTCGIYMIVWLYMFSKQELEIAAAKGVTLATDNAIILMILQGIIPIYSFYLFCETHNKLVEGE